MNDASFLFLEGVVTCHEKLRGFAQTLRNRSDVTKVTHWVDLHNIKEGICVEEFVDAELSNGETVSWALEITASTSAWNLEADLRRIYHAGQDVIEQWVAQTTDVSDCTEEISRLTDCLMQSVELID